MDLTFGRLATGGMDAPYMSIVEALREHDVVIVDFDPSVRPVEHLTRTGEAVGGGRSAAHGTGAVTELVDSQVDAARFARYDRSPERWPTNQSPHTHGWHLDQPPAVVAQFCISNAEIGGESTFISARAMLRSLRQRFSRAELRPLWEPDAAGTTISGDTISRAVFTRHDCSATTPSRVSCTFSCHEFNRTIPSGMALPAFDFCREFVRLRENQEVLKLDPGQCVFARNTSVLTGRRGWSDDRSGFRHFVYAWIASRDSAFRGFLDDGNHEH